ncbi:hypothetical protein [Deinococcus sp. UYEF24]
MEQGLVRVPLFVNQKKLEWIISDPHAKTQRFLASFSSKYFSYLLKLHKDNLDDEDTKYPAATALRQLYMQVLETTMAFFGAMMQAPDAVPMWIQKYNNSDLRLVVQSIQDGVILPDRTHAINLESLAHQFTSNFRTRGEAVNDLDIESIKAELKISLPRALSYMMADFLNQDLNDEYNSIKHGLRVSAGSNTLSIRPEDSSDSVDLTNAFASSFPVLRELNKADRQFTLVNVTLGFDPVNIIFKTSTCIRVLNFLRFQLALSVHGELEFELDVPNEEEIIKGWETHPANTQLPRFSLNF